MPFHFFLSSVVKLFRHGLFVFWSHSKICLKSLKKFRQYVGLYGLYGLYGMYGVYGLYGLYVVYGLYYKTFYGRLIKLECLLLSVSSTLV